MLAAFRAILTMAMLGSTAAAQTTSVAATHVLDAARRALGDEAAVTAVRTIETVAACKGPRGTYETHVISARDGRAVFEQRFPDGRVERQLVTNTTPADVNERTMIQGHEIHMLVVAPETRFGAPLAVDDSVFEGQPAVVVTFHDALGAPVLAFFARADSLPLGFVFLNHRTDGAPRITLTIDAWHTVDGLRLPARAVYHQAGDLYDFRFTTVRLDAPFPEA